MNKFDSQTELNKAVGAMFLSNSLFKTSVHITHDMLNHEGINHEERVKYEITKNISNHMMHTSSKEIKKEQVYSGEVHSLELYLFPTPSLKLAVEYIVSQMPQSEIDRIRKSNI